MTAVGQHRGSVAGIGALLDSRSIAIVGASDRPGSPGARVLHILRESGYDGEVVAINPRLPELVGARVQRSLDECVPGSVDHVLVLTPAATVPDVLRACVRLRVGAVTLLSSGFADDEHGASPAEQFRAIVGDARLRILGPNCLGVVNAHTGLVASPASAFMSGTIRPGPVSIVSQSGAVGAYLVGMLADEELGVRYFTSTGNEADLQLGEVVMHYAEDDETRVIVIYLEGLRDAATFIDALVEARRRGKNVVIVKAGDTEVGAAAVRSHTAALAGDDAVYDAVFERLGAVRAGSLGEAVSAVRASVAPTRTQHRVRRTAVLTTSGGLGILAAEALVREGFDLPAVPADTQARMKALLPFCTPGNPIDLGGTVPAEKGVFLELLGLTVASLELDALVMVVSNMPRSPVAWRGIRETLVSFARARPAVMAVVGALSEEDVRLFRRLGVITAADPLDAAKELSVLDRVTQRRATSASIAHPRPSTSLTALEAMDDLAAMELLAGNGVPFPAWVVVDVGADDLPPGLDEVGLPAAVKLLQPGVLHKAAAGNVATGVGTRGEVHALVSGFRAKAAGRGSVLVQPMVDHAVAEVIVSARRDATFGPTYVIGSGGRLVELLQDRVLLLEPVTAADVAAALAGLRYLGDLGDGADDCVRAVTDVVLALQRLLADDPSVCEVEVNPVILRGEAPYAVAVDAVVLTDRRDARSPHRSEQEEMR